MMNLKPRLFWLITYSTVLLCHPAFTNAQSAEPSWYKGNLHTHSLWSDGDDFPDMIVRWYAERDYHFLALTDHNILSDSEKWMSASAIEKRGGKGVVAKYIEAFGQQNVDVRQKDDASKEVRLKTFAECEKLFNKPGSFVLMTGEEISDQVDGLPLHMNATNLQKLLRPTGGRTMREAMRANLRAAKIQADDIQREILVHLNHPNFGWAVTAEDLAAVTEERFFEVYNAHPAVNHNGDDTRASIEKIWDIANTIRVDKLKAEPVLGLATDDSHAYHGTGDSQPGRGWIMVRSNELSPNSIVSAINQGEFYASSGVSLIDFTFDEDSQTLRIEIEPEDGVMFTTRFIGTPIDYDDSSSPRKDTNGKKLKTTRKYSDDVGKVFKTAKGTSVEYQMTGNELYVRATITSSRKHPNPTFKNQFEQAWIQPVVGKRMLKKSR